MLRNLVFAQCTLLILFVCVLPGCVDQPVKPRHFGMYRLDPIRDALHIDGTVYDDAQSIGTVQEIVSNKDGFYLMVEFTEQR
jgi:hypothetical protein